VEPGYPLTSKRRRLPEEGSIEVFVADEQSRGSSHAVDGARWQKLAENVLRAEGIRGEAELSLLFVDESTMTELNKRFMGQEQPTDVLAFPLEDDLVGAGRWPDNGPTGPASNRIEVEEAPLLLGDVVVCPSVAAANAPSHAGTYDDEIALLVVHGILHVLGMDHADPEEATVMQAKERSLLERFHQS
jgi:probable rRNA maturation factor